MLDGKNEEHEFEGYGWMSKERIDKLTKFMLVQDIVEREAGMDAKEEIIKKIAE